MDYISFIPTDLNIIILSYLADYNDITNYSKLFDYNQIYNYLSESNYSHHINNYIYNLLFKIVYPYMYGDIKNVIDDDLHLKNIPNEWLELFARFRHLYNNNFIKNLFMIRRNKFNVDNISFYNTFVLKDNIEEIIWRAAFYKKFPIIYNQLKVYDHLINNINKSNNIVVQDLHTIPYKQLYVMFAGLFGTKYISAGEILTAKDILTTRIYNLYEYEDITKIFNIILSDKKVLLLFIKNKSISITNLPDSDKKHRILEYFRNYGIYV